MFFLFLRQYSFYFQPSSLLKHSKKSYLGSRCSKPVLCQGRKVLQNITIANTSMTMFPGRKYTAWLDHNTWPQCSRLAHTFAYISSKHLYWSQSFNASDFLTFLFVCFTARNFTLGNYPSTILYLPRIYWREVAHNVMIRDRFDWQTSLLHTKSLSHLVFWTPSVISGDKIVPQGCMVHLVSKSVR